MKEQIKEIMLSFRVTSYELNRIRGLARMYAAGDVSAWMRWAAFNAERKIIKKRTPQTKSEGSKRKSQPN